MGPADGDESFEGLFLLYENLTVVDVNYRARKDSSFGQGFSTVLKSWPWVAGGISVGAVMSNNDSGDSLGGFATSDGGAGQPVSSSDGFQSDSSEG